MTCPICQKDTDAKYRPFCSRRCADIDLGRWLKGSYVIPGTAQEEDDPAPSGQAPEENPRH
ncbi:DNA gyrase inhibitor YacG [Gemmobacter lanyuensis]|uniref:DNA gyrase inhibitor YacG n=1 Tax=Gemmobacter lanyuensis TaxID=1054497 RepID=A0A918J4C9_9RHOB|nr:DNA gyrase inhibitor YacG [Gemmobacter lanyuensis]GGW47356.1 DNA gyrase inhibitor YacG [Gemmobacter lanyuensis]